ncbi:MAG: prepilin-type N-terminal cleavage/methylation domain-containing protein [Candidatus Levybacteria bacterium]|nr:prepilin-type N-terminal cleavage/methylation domain-containing protein [Candidatus Levybacteria bacterium]
MKIFKINKGFTLIEFILYMGIFTILLTVTLQMFGSIFDVQLESEAHSSVESDGRFILSRFSYDISRAQSISAPVSYGSPSPSLSIVINGQTITYSLGSSDFLLQNEGTGTMDQLNSGETSVSDLSFMRLEGDSGKDVIQILFTLTSETTKRSGKEINTFQTTAGMR